MTKKRPRKSLRKTMAKRWRAFVKSQRKKNTPKRNRQVLLIGALLIMLMIWLAQPAPPPVITDEASFFEALAPTARDIGREYDLYPSVILAQAALESDFGRSELAKTYHNYFGIKSTGREKSVRLPTSEYLDGQWHTMSEPFRVYRSAEGSIRDYARLITGLERYRPVVDAASPEQAAYALVQGGYATDPAYAEKVIQLINTYSLKSYDNQ